MKSGYDYLEQAIRGLGVGGARKAAIMLAVHPSTMSLLRHRKRAPGPNLQDRLYIKFGIPVLSWRKP